VASKNDELQNLFGTYLLHVLPVRGAREERFLSAQADDFAGAKTEERIGPLRSE
jgi:hypothetical protein